MLIWIDIMCVFENISFVKCRDTICILNICLELAKSANLLVLLGRYSKLFISVGLCEQSAFVIVVEEVKKVLTHRHLDTVRLFHRIFHNKYLLNS